jgi:hypothetical protein
MIIKRWDGSAFVKEHPETKAQLIRNTGDTQSVFDSNDKLRPTYLPDVAFDGLRFYAATTANVGAPSPRILLASILIAAKDEVVAAGNTIQALKGYYFVINTAGTITGVTGIQDTLTSNEYATLQFRPQDGASNDTVNTSSGVLEVGDWFVIETVTGSGSVGDPWIFTASVINNAYELATTSIDGIVRLSSRTTYASLSGNNVVGESTLKTVIDNAAFAAGTHVHGNITNDGSMTSTVVAPANADTILIADSTNSGKIERGITIGTATTTYLRNDGTWATPVGTTYGIATNTVPGLIELFDNTDQSVAANTVSTTAGRTYGIQLNAANQAVVNVPWTDTNTTYSQATTSTLGLIKLGVAAAAATVNTASTTAGRFYHLGSDADGNGYVNVPWTDTISTAATGGGLSVSSNAFRMAHPFFVQADAPATPLTGTIWFDL